jgi:hypothetical protein
VTRPGKRRKRRPVTFEDLARKAERIGALSAQMTARGKGLCEQLVPKPEIVAAGVMPRPIADYQPCGKPRPCPDHPPIETQSK